MTSHQHHQSIKEGRPDWPARGLTGWLTGFFVAPGDSPTDTAVRMRLGLLQGWVSIVGNLALFVVKGVLGLLLGSVALLADAVHSLSDVGSSLVVVCGFYWARRPRDSRHPFGHGRVELVTALIVAVLLVVMAIEFARMGILRIIDPVAYTAPWWMIVVVTLALLAKQWMTVFAQCLARATRSQALAADYWHHVSDVLSTALVLLALIASRAGWSGLDGWAGLGVAVFILYTGVMTALHAISPLLGEAPDPEEVRRVETSAYSVHGVRGVHDIILHKYGDMQLVSFHIEVDAHRSAMDVHDLAEHVEAEVEDFCGVKAIVHVDPVDRSHPQYGAAEDVMRDVVAGQNDVSEYHDLRVEGTRDHLILSVDVVANVATKESDYEELEERVKQSIRNSLEGLVDVRVTVEKGFHGSV